VLRRVGFAGSKDPAYVLAANPAYVPTGSKDPAYVLTANPAYVLAACVLRGHC